MLVVNTIVSALTLNFEFVDESGVMFEELFLGLVDVWRAVWQRG